MVWKKLSRPRPLLMRIIYWVVSKATLLQCKQADRSATPPSLAPSTYRLPRLAMWRYTNNELVPYSGHIALKYDFIAVQEKSSYHYYAVSLALGKRQHVVREQTPWLGNSQARTTNSV